MAVTRRGPVRERQDLEARLPTADPGMDPTAEARVPLDLTRQH